MQTEENEPTPTLDSMFVAFAKLGLTQASEDGSQILLSQLDRWMQQSEMFDEDFTITNTGAEYNKFKKWSLSYDEFLIYLENICRIFDFDLETVKNKMTNCSVPLI